MLGRRCDLRDQADSAVVFVNPSEGGTRILPKLRCAGDQASPHVLVLEGRLTAAAKHKGGVAVGCRRGEEAIAHALVMTEDQHS